jgi:hypothetical protein
MKALSYLAVFSLLVGAAACTGGTGTDPMDSGNGTCSAPNTMCGTMCVNTQTSSANCGACGTACGTGQTCMAGVCTGGSMDGGTDSGTDGSVPPDTTTPDGSSPEDGSSPDVQAPVDVAGDTGAGCNAPNTMCGTACVNTNTSSEHCGACNNACGSSETCSAGVCRPANDDRANATEITLGDSEALVVGNTTGATHDGPTVSCSCANDRPNVWYRFTLTERSVVYFDTYLSSGLDTSLFITDSNGTLVPGQALAGFPSDGLCNDDAGCDPTATGWNSTDSRTAGVLDAGTYFIAVGGCGEGSFTLGFQRLRSSRVAFQYADRLMGTGVTSSTVLLTTGQFNASCGGLLGTGEDERWFLSCGGENVTFSLCQSDGGSWTANEGSEGSHDPVLSVHSANTGMEVACNDDAADATSGQCIASDVDPNTGSNFGARIPSTAAPRGLNSVVIDSRSGPGSMSYTLSYSVQ